MRNSAFEESSDDGHWGQHLMDEHGYGPHDDLPPISNTVKGVHGEEHAEDHRDHAAGRTTSFDHEHLPSGEIRHQNSNGTYDIFHDRRS
jgi:hypothetical protein